MKLTTLLFFLALMQVTATSSYSQTQRMSLDFKNKTLAEIFSVIEQNSDFSFFYKNELLQDTKVKTGHYENVMVSELLEDVLKDENLTYTSKGKLIMIIPKNGHILGEGKQQIKVSGKVTDSFGTSLPGVTVLVKGTTSGIVTDVNGNYSLSNIPGNATLVFSFIGMKTQEIPVFGKTTINVTMEEEAVGIEEVVAIGYGTQKKENLVGAVAVASAERLENRTMISAGQGLQGVVPGLNIRYKSGDPNEAADFNIRGTESINGGSPLILVDGIPMSLETLNPNDIESISVLKDASSAAVYGARAAFGVILVKTKKGKLGKTNISFSAQMTMQEAIFPGYEPVKDGALARQVLNEAFLLTRGRKLIPQEVVDAAVAYQELSNPTEADAWYYHSDDNLYFLGNNYMRSLAMRDFAPQHKYDFNISGASDKASYYVSFGATSKDGFFRYGNESYNRYNVLSKTEFKVTDWLTLEEKLSFTSIHNDDPHSYGSQYYYSSVTRWFVMPVTFPDLPYYKEPGDRDEYAKYIGMYFNRDNPIPYLKYGGRDTRTQNDIWLSQAITISPLKGLDIKGDFSYQYYWDDYEKVATEVEQINGFLSIPLKDPITTLGVSSADQISNSFEKDIYYVFNAYAQYTREDLGDHSVSALLGYNQEYGRYHGVTASSKDFIAQNIHSLSATSGNMTTTDSKNEMMLRGVFYRLNYAYKNKYLFEANGRYDGTSRFPHDDRFGFFPSFSLGWRLSEEPFMEGAKNWLDNLKVRANYGQLGNQYISNSDGQVYYPYISSMNSTTTNFLMNGGGTLTKRVAPPGLISSTLTWETVENKNIGIDFTMFNRKLDVSFDYYIRDTKDMLMKKDYPGPLGATAPNENAADLRNTGWELAVTWRDKIGKDWSYGVNFSLSDNQSEITKYDNPTGKIDDYYVGQKLGEVWGLQTVGLFQTEEELANAADQSRIGSNWRLGDIHYANLDDDDEITVGSRTLDDHGDLIRIANSTPRYSFGINPTIRYKNFSLNIFAQGLLKRTWYPDRDNFLRFFPFKSSSMEQWWIDDSWTPENRDAYFPGIQYAYSDNKNTYNQTRYVQNAAYIRLKNVTLSYDIPLKFVSRAQIYINGTNLWEASGMYKTLDPESYGDLEQRYMFNRAYTIGLNITL